MNGLGTSASQGTDANTGSTRDYSHVYGPSMDRMSPAQACKVWSELEDALRGTNGFGGDIAEIYAYRLWPTDEPAYSPGRSDPDLPSGRIGCIGAAANLKSLLELFSQERNCSIEVNGLPLAQFPADEPFHWRAHVKVTPNL